MDLTNCIKQIAKPDCQLSFSSGSVRTVPVSAYCVTPGSAGTESETGRCLLCISVSSDAGSWTIKPKTSSDDLKGAQSFIWENLNQSKVPVFVWAQAHVFVPQNPVCESWSAAKLDTKQTKIRLSKFIVPEELTQNQNQVWKLGNIDSHSNRWCLLSCVLSQPCIFPSYFSLTFTRTQI